MHDNNTYCILKSNGQEHSKFQKHQTKTNWENFRKVDTSAQSLFIKKASCYNVASHGYCWLVRCACNMALGNVLDTHHLSTAGGPLLVRHAVNGQEAGRSGVGHWRGWRITCAERIRMILWVGTDDRTTSKMI